MARPGRPNVSALAPTWRTLAVAVVLLTAITASSADRRRGSRDQSPLGNLRRCQQPPRFSVDGVEPMALVRGKVTLVALLTNTCSFCIQQSEAMAELYQELNADGNDGVNMMIVDAGPPPQNVEDGIFERRVPFSVYHDDRQRTIWRQVFRGSKDDILVFNECGMLTYHIRFPYSYLGYRLVRRAIRFTASDRFCREQCPSQAAPQDRMQGDAPMPARWRSAQQHHQHQHPVDDDNVSHARGRRTEGAATTTTTRGGGFGYGSAGGFARLRQDRGEMAGGSLRGRFGVRGCPLTDALCRELRRETRRYNRFLLARGLTRRAAMMNERRILEMLRRARFMAH